MVHVAHQSKSGWGTCTFGCILAGLLLALPLNSATATEPTGSDPSSEVTNSVGDTTPEVGREDATKGAMVLEGSEAGSILGKEVRSATDEKLGRIVDVIVDRRGTTRAAVIDFGGFLGVGSKKIAVAWEILIFRVPPGGEGRITVQTTRDRLNKAPEFKDGKPITVLGVRDEATRAKVTLKASEW